MENEKKIKVKGRFILVVFVISLVVVVGAIVATNSVQASRNNTIAQIDRIMASLETTDGSKPALLSEEQRNELAILKRSSIKYVRNTAIMLLADDAYEQGDFAQALALYKEVSSQRNGHMVPKATLNVAYTLVAMNENEEALDVLSQMLKSRTDIMTTDMQYEAEILQAYLLERDNLPRSLEIYQNVVQSLDPENVWYMVAQARLMILS